MSDRQMFIQLMSASASVLRQTETFLYECLLDQWWGKVCLLSHFLIQDHANDFK